MSDTSDQSSDETPSPNSGPQPGPELAGVDLVVLTGLSGSGKSTALRALEDLGFYCVDNLPSDLLGDVARLAADSPSIQRVALAMDVRHAGLGDELAPRLREFIDSGDTPVQIVFLTASDDKVIARFSETRRRHPLMTAGEAQSLRQAIIQERRWLEPLRHMANWVIDTTGLTVHDLKRQIQDHFGEPGQRSAALTIMSFGFRYGPPREADFVFDVRYLKNPYFDATLRGKTGQDAAVASYVLTQPEAQTVLNHITQLLTDVLPWCDKEGKATVTVAIGCTGGQHRSVAMAEAVAAAMAGSERPLNLQHREVALARIAT